MGMERPFRPVPALAGIEVAEFVQKQKIAGPGKHEMIGIQKQVESDEVVASLLTNRSQEVPGQEGYINIMVVAERDDDELINVPPRSKGQATGVVLKQRKRPNWEFASSLFAEYRTVRCSAFGLLCCVS